MPGMHNVSRSLGTGTKQNGVVGVGGTLRCVSPRYFGKRALSWNFLWRRLPFEDESRSLRDGDLVVAKLANHRQPQRTGVRSLSIGQQYRHHKYHVRHLLREPGLNVRIPVWRGRSQEQDMRRRCPQERFWRSRRLGSGDLVYSPGDLLRGAMSLVSNRIPIPLYPYTMYLVRNGAGPKVTRPGGEHLKS